MKKLGIGEATRGGGFSATLRMVQQGGEPISITKGNEVVAVLMPCNEELVRFFEDAMSWGKVLKTLSNESDEAVKMLLVHQVALGFMAKVALTSTGNAEMIAAFEKTMADRLHTGVQRKQQRDRTEDSATVGTDMSAVPMEGKSRRRKSAAKPKQSPPRKR